MVFNVAEEVNQPDQASVVKGKQRKISGRKSKAALTSSAVKARDPVSSLGGTKNNHSGAPEDDMGNTSTAQTTGTINNALSTVSQQDGTAVLAEGAGTMSNSTKNITTKHVDEKIRLTNNGGQDIPMDTSTSEKITTTSDFDLKMEATGNDPEADVARLKQLLLLQVSLISRQQDLLRLRDREIMQLKASNSNYKCQLSRVRRRMSKRKSDGLDESPKSSKRKSSEGPTETGTLVDQELATPGVPILSPSSSLDDAVKATDHGQKSKKRRFDSAEADLKTPTIAQNTPSTSTAQKSLDFSDSPCLLSTPQSEKGRVPVPIAFIQQKQAELMQAMMISPPDKAIKQFCDITNSSPPLDEFPFKICDRCPHCVAIAQEITRLLKVVEKTQSPELKQTKTMKPAEKEIIKLAGVTFPVAEIEEGDNKSGVRNSTIMRTTASYYRISPTFDQNHWWWDLKCGNIKTENALKIPMWKEQVMAPLPFESRREVTEATDDQTFTKRHSKLELDEKRRKRWDIQRIREYRYNEKLRQKLLKQGAVYDAPVIESFSGHLHDAESVEVQESLPVNVFGYPAPHMDFEEFDLVATQESFKNMMASGGRKKTKRT